MPSASIAPSAAKAPSVAGVPAGRTGFALSGEQEGDGEGSAQHIGSKAGVASGVGAFAKEAGRVIHRFEFGHYRCASSSN